MTVEIHDDHEVDHNEKFEIHLSHVASHRSHPDHIGDINKVTVAILEKEG